MMIRKRLTKFLFARRFINVFRFATFV